MYDINNALSLDYQNDLWEIFCGLAATEIRTGKTNQFVFVLLVEKKINRVGDDKKVLVQ